MKKTLKVLCALALFATVPTMLVACDNPTSSVQDENQQIVNDALAKLSVDATVTADFSLPTKGLGGTTFTWESSNTNVISINGGAASVVRPTDENATVKLTVTGTCGTATGKREFTVVVEKNDIGEYVTVLDAFNSAIGTKARVRGVVTAIIPNAGFWITDATKSMYVYGGNVANTLTIGDEIVFTAERSQKEVGSSEKGKIQAQQLSYPDTPVTIAKNVTPAKNCAIEGKTIQEINAITDNITCNVYKITGKFTKYVNNSKGYATYEIMDSSNKYIPFYSTTTFTVDDKLDAEYSFMEGKLNQEVTAAIAIQGQTSSGFWRANLLWLY